MKNTTYENIRVEITGKENSVALITLNRPEALNAIDTPLMTDLSAALDDIEADMAIRTVIITGEGRAFSAGGDIKEELKKTLITAYAYCRRGAALMEKIERLRVPVIAALNGYTLGGGCELALACDIRVASTKAKLGLPEVTLPDAWFWRHTASGTSGSCIKGKTDYAFRGNGSGTGSLPYRHGR